MINLRAEDILDPEYLPVYKRELAAVWHQAVEVNVTIFLLERIVPFPFALFADHQAEFWATVTRALYESAVSGVWRIAVDTHPDSLTIRSLKNAVLKHVSDPNAREKLQHRLKEIDFTATMNTIEQQIDELRHKMFAHHDRSAHASALHGNRRISGVPLTELKSAHGLVNKMIDVLGFNIVYERLPLDYKPEVIHPPGSDPRPDIEVILDELAASSEILNIPERRPNEWPYLRANLSPEEIAAINVYRKRLRMEPIA